MSATVIAEPELEDEVQPPRRLRRLLLVVLVLIGGAAAAGYLLLGGGDEVEPPEVDGEIVTLEPMTTTVGESSMHHARVAVAVVLSEGEDPTLVEDRSALLQDALLRELARMDGAEVRSAEGSDALRAALTEEAKEIWGEAVIRRVVLTELLIN